MNINYSSYYLNSHHKKAREFRKNRDYRGILDLALRSKVFKVDDIYQETSVSEGKKERGRIIGTMLKNLIHWGFIIKTGEKDNISRQEYFKINESLRKDIRKLIEE